MILVDGVVCASVFRRFFAFVVDLFALFMLFGFIFLASLNSNEYYKAVFLLVVSLIIAFLYFIYFEGPSSGCTLGKYIFSIRVVDQENFKNISYKNSIIRNILRIVDFFPYFIPGLVGLITILVSKKNQRIGDIAAKTIVIQEK